MAGKKSKKNNSKYLIVLAFAAIAYFLFTRLEKGVIPTESSHAKKDQHAQSAPYDGPLTASVFIPYWKVSQAPTLAVPAPAQATSVRPLYFGVSVLDSGAINTQDSGYAAHALFLKKYGSTNAGLVVRFLDQEQNGVLLQNATMQSRVIRNTVSFAKKNGYGELVIDLEVNALPLASTKSAIDTFLSAYLKSIKESGLRASILVYGDVYYRARPYDPNSLLTQADTVYFMLYDLHKSRGEPGPNFPLDGGHSDYSVKKLVSDLGPQDYSKIVPVFGMYGYDWKIDSQRRSLKAATAYTYTYIQDTFGEFCSYPNCSTKEDAKSTESLVTYNEGDGYEHEIWFETPQSIEKKLEFLKKQGVRSYSIWAGGYY